MKKILIVLLLGGLMVSSVFAFNANAPRVYQDLIFDIIIKDAHAFGESVGGEILG